MDTGLGVVVVIPTYNECENLAPLTVRVREVLPDVKVLVVDDNSPDGTGEIADTLAAESPEKVAVLHRPEKQGLGAAYAAGYQHAMQLWPDARCFIQMDADFSHDPSLLPSLLEAVKEADLAVGSRYTNGVSVVNWPLSRLIISKLASTYARIVTGLPLTDSTGGFKCYRLEVLRAIDLSQIRSNGYCFQIETSFRAWRKGFRLKDVPIVFYERQRGKSKLNLSIALEGFLIVLQLGAERLFRPSTGCNPRA
ncbi:MAG: polyprenol monophosphomannose synthase [Candidatus Hydrogenedentes bacterium]|nr:polyprenol monophosphomannose synthase [Candidatus Hydrogenedentota bacterium]